MCQLKHLGNMRSPDDRQKEKWCLISASTPNKKLAIFIHGYRGNYLTTWGRLSALLKVNADNDPIFNEWDFLFLGYSTLDVKTYLSISDLIGTQIDNARNARLPFKNNYNEFALFGHSLGTLGIRQYLCAISQQPNKCIDDLKSVVLFGSPLNGSLLAHFDFFYEIADALKSSNPQLQMLRIWNETSHYLRPWIEVQVILGLNDKVVGSENAHLVTWAGDRNPYTLSTLDHSELVKPDRWVHSCQIDHIKQALM
jgi:pimeloyl-ACP methyl ester carboxylesterase